MFNYRCVDIRNSYFVLLLALGQTMYPQCCPKNRVGKEDNKWKIFSSIPCKALYLFLKCTKPFKPPRNSFHSTVKRAMTTISTFSNTQDQVVHATACLFVFNFPIRCRRRAVDNSSQLCSRAATTFRNQPANCSSSLFQGVIQYLNGR